MHRLLSCRTIESNVPNELALKPRLRTESTVTARAAAVDKVKKSQRCRGLGQRKKNTGRRQTLAQDGGAVQVKALPDLWISFSLLRLLGAALPAKLPLAAIKAAFI